MSTIFALCAALSNALYVATQHIASTSGRAGEAKGLRVVFYLVRSPLWLFGWLAALGGFAFQAAALNKGHLSIVQALLVTELIFSLLLRRLWLRQSIRSVAWLSATVTCLGLAAFVALDEPQGGRPTPAAHTWVAVLAVFGGATLVMTVAARWGSPRRRAALYATSAAIVTALVATFIKTASDTLTESGVVAVFTHWPVYALAASGVAGIFLVQAALHVGPLSISQPLLVIVDPTASVILSVWLFHEHYTHSPAEALGSVVSFVVMCLGVVALTQTAPETMQAAATAPPAG